jgi:hypothetical protein
LDGSPPAYQLRTGFGSGSRSWLVNLEVIDPSFSVFIHVLNANLETATTFTQCCVTDSL